MSEMGEFVSKKLVKNAANSVFSFAFTQLMLECISVYLTMFAFFGKEQRAIFHIKATLEVQGKMSKLPTKT